MARYCGIYLAVSEIISSRDDAWNLSGGYESLLTPIGSAHAKIYSITNHSSNVKERRKGVKYGKENLLGADMLH